MKVDLVVGGREHTVEIEPGTDEDEYRVMVDGEPFDIHVGRSEEPGATLCKLNGSEHHVRRQGRVLYVDDERVDVAVRHLAQARAGGGLGAGGEVFPPMPGRVLEILVQEGDEVETGQTLLVLEAMKMQNEIKAEGPGVVKEIPVAEDETVEASDVLMVVEPA